MPCQPVVRPIKNYQKMVSVQKIVWAMQKVIKAMWYGFESWPIWKSQYTHNVFFECCTSLLTYILTLFISIEELNTSFKNVIARYIISQRKKLEKRKQPKISFNAHKTMYAPLALLIYPPKYSLHVSFLLNSILCGGVLNFYAFTTG